MGKEVSGMSCLKFFFSKGKESQSGTYSAPAPYIKGLIKIILPILLSMKEKDRSERRMLKQPALSISGADVIPILSEENIMVYYSHGDASSTL